MRMQAVEPDAGLRTVDIEGVAIRCRDSGGDGQPVLLTHGIGGSLELWNRQFDDAGLGLRLIAWDMPSHGLSAAAPGDTDLEAIARLAWRLLDALGVERAVLAGNSLGGAVSLRMAGQSPQRVRGLLMAAAATMSRETMLPFRLMSVKGLGELMTLPGPVAVAQQVKAIVLQQASITPEVRAAIERNVMRPGGAAHFLALLRGLTNLGGQQAAVLRRSEDLLRQLRVPTVFVHGRQDVVLPVAHSERARQLVPGSVLEVLEACGHTPQLEQPAAFNRLLVGLAAGLPAA